MAIYLLLQAVCISAANTIIGISMPKPDSRMDFMPDGSFRSPVNTVRAIFRKYTVVKNVLNNAAM